MTVWPKLFIEPLSICFVFSAELILFIHFETIYVVNWTPQIESFCHLSIIYNRPGWLTSNATSAHTHRYTQKTMADWLWLSARANHRALYV